MALTPSNMLPLGTVAPGFSLLDTVSGKTLNLEQVRGTQATVVMFICNHCPFVRHVNSGLVQLANDYAAKGVGVVAIGANDAVTYPADAPERMTETARELGYPFPYLYDGTQAVAKAYQAACTPDFYVFDADLKLAYRGQLDDSRPGNNIPVSGKDLRLALNAILAHEPVSEHQKASIGCGIKWKKGA